MSFSSRAVRQLAWSLTVALSFPIASSAVERDDSAASALDCVINPSVVADLGEVNIRRLDRMDDGRLLLSVEGPIHNRRVARIVRFDPVTRDSRALFAGRAAHFAPGRAGRPCAVHFDAATSLGQQPAEQVDVAFDTAAHRQVALVQVSDGEAASGVGVTPSHRGVATVRTR